MPPNDAVEMLNRGDRSILVLSHVSPPVSICAHRSGLLEFCVVALCCPAARV